MSVSLPFTDLLIVGAGPAGLHAAFYAGLRGLSVRLLDARPEPGGQLSALYPDRVVYDVPGSPEVLAAKLTERLVRQAAPFDPDYRLGEVAQTLTASDDGWQLGTDRGEYRAGAVILAAGLGALRPRADDWPPHSPLPAGPVWVRGGVPQATRAATMLAQAGQPVTLSHSRALFRGTPADLAQLAELRAAGQLTVQAPAAPDWQPAGATMTTLTLNSYLPDLSPVQGWPLGWAGDYVTAGPDGRTALAGVYAVGDVTAAGEGFKLISVGFAQAAVAANHAVHHVRHELKVQPGHSTDRQIPARPSAAQDA